MHLHHHKPHHTWFDSIPDPVVAMMVTNTLPKLFESNRDKYIRNVAIQRKHYNYVQGCFQRGAKYYEQDNYDMALKEYNNIISIDSSRTYMYMAYLCRGIILCMKEEYDLAIQDLTKSIEMNFDADGSPRLEEDKINLINTYLFRGAIWFEEKEYGLAIQDYKNLLEISPNHPEALNGLLVSTSRLHMTEGDSSNFAYDERFESIDDELAYLRSKKSFEEYKKSSKF